MGVNLIDTTDVCGPCFNEELIAEVLYPYPDALVVTTKGGPERSSVSRTSGANSFDPNGRPEFLRAACEVSLARLRLDTIDLYQLHWPDPTVPYWESVGALTELRSEGKSRAVGLSNVSLAQLRAAQTVTLSRRFRMSTT